MIDIVLQEIDNPWADDEPLRRILDLLDHNPFGQFEEMSFDVALEWSSYVRDEALKHLRRRKKSSVGFRTVGAFPMLASISKNPLQNTATLVLGRNDFPSAEQTDTLLSFAKHMMRCFPLFSWAKGRTDPAVNEFYDSKNLLRVPSCFMNYLAWFHLISPLGYGPYFDREDLLNMPAYDVQELEDGIIQVITYKDPLDFASEESRQRIIEITNYLNHRRKDWK